MGELSIAQQALGLRTEFPASQIQVSAQALAWTGILTPTHLSRDYTVTLTYRPGCWPTVLIVDPALRCDVDGGIPHLYRDGTICLYDTNQWNPTLLFVDTIIPWTSEWLHHYELWVATGTWYGDGDVPLDLAPIDTPEKPASPVDRRPSTQARRRPTSHGNRRDWTQ